MKKRILSLFLASLMLLSVIPVFTASALTLGDVDGDGGIKATDARLALRASVGLEIFDAEKTAAADVDFDGAIKAADARLILRASVGLEQLHSHEYTKETVIKKTTCTEKGEKKLSCECGDFITEEIAATGHKKVTDKAVAATCTKAGKTEGSHCSVCGEVLKAQETVKAAGHKKVLDKTTVKNATCKEDGYSGDYKCSVCGVVITKGKVVKSKGTEHVLTTITVEASCTQEGYTVTGCKNCDYYDETTYKSGAAAKGHSWSKKTTVNPTCTEQGYKTRTCSACKATEKSDYTDPKGHNYTWVTTKAASCKEAGARTGTCKTCGTKKTELLPITACTPDTKVTKVEGSKENNIPCKEVIKCKVCEKVLSESHTATAHKTRVVSQTEETCTTARIVTEECRNCNYTYTNNNAADPLGHTMTPESVTYATCTVDGAIVYKGHCDRCDKTFDSTVVVLKAKGHAPSGIQTCTTDVICTNANCGEILAPRLGHDYTVHSAAYEKEIDTFFCDRCGVARSAAENLNVFNNTANNIKTYAFYNNYIGNADVNYVDKSTVNTTYSRFDFGIYTSAIRDMYEDEMANTPDEYSPIRKARVRQALPLRTSPSLSTVSELTSSDIDSIKVERLSGLNVGDAISGFATTYTIGSKTYDLSAYKNVKIDKDVIKVTVDVKNEKYSTVKSLPDTQKTALSKIYDIDIRDEANEFKNEKGELIKSELEKGDGYEISMTMILTEIKSDAVVTYYFDAETYEPIIALYDTGITMEQNIDMSFKIGLFSLNGEMDPIITTNYSRAYFFPNYFTK